MDSLLFTLLMIVTSEEAALFPKLLWPLRIGRELEAEL